MKKIQRVLQICLVTAFVMLPAESALARVVVKKQVQGKYSTLAHTKRNFHAIKANKSHRHLASDMFDAYAGKESGTNLALASSKVLVMNQNTNEIIYSKNLDTPTPIASVTKLMTAMVVLDAKLNLRDEVTISDADVDYIKGTSSRLSVGTTVTREDLLNLALIASENRAASALSTSYPGGRSKFVQDMNAKAASLGMQHTHFADATGLDSNNVSTAQDLAKMVQAAYQYPLIRQITTTPGYDLLAVNRRQPMHFNNTNTLVRTEQSQWDIGLSKTGYISEAGRCLVMQATIAGEPMIMVLLDSVGKLTRIGDAKRVKKWMEQHYHGTSAQRDNQDELMLTGLAMSRNLGEANN